MHNKSVNYTNVAMIVERDVNENTPITMVIIITNEQVDDTRTPLMVIRIMLHV